MQGYLNNEVATKETLDEDGWLKTGDIGYYDSDYYFYIVDRTKELIKVKGNQVSLDCANIFIGRIWITPTSFIIYFQVSPTELENIITEIDGVADVAIAGIPDELAGEIPRAYVVLKPNSKLEANDIIEHVKGRCIKYKWLEGGVKFVKAVPRNPGGKIVRKDLRFLD